MDPYYADDMVTLYHGDCLEIDEWLDADVLVTDPPYGMNAGLVVPGQLPTSRSRNTERIAGDQDTRVRDAVLDRWGDRPAVVFGHWRKPRPEQVRHLLIWDKGEMAMGAASAPFAVSHEEIYIRGSGFIPGRRQTVLRCKSIKGDERRGHPTPKPIGLMEDLIRACPDGVIADPFAGSGSTLLAARNLGRHAIGVELEERYCEIIARRLSQGVLL